MIAPGDRDLRKGAEATELLLPRIPVFKIFQNPLCVKTNREHLDAFGCSRKPARRLIPVINECLDSGGKDDLLWNAEETLHILLCCLALDEIL